VTLDNHIRKRLIAWCNTVAQEDPGTTNHTNRVAIARTMLSYMAPALVPREDPVASAIYAVELRLPDPTLDTDDNSIDVQINSVMVTAAALGAWQS